MISKFNRKDWIQALVIFLTGLVLIYWLSPNFSSIKQFEIPQQDIQIIPATWDELSRRLNSSDEITLASKQFKSWENIPRQFHYTLENTPKNELAIFIPNAGGACRFFISGVLDDPCKPLNNLNFMYGSHALYKEINKSNLSQNKNRIDVILSDDINHIGIRQIFLGDQNTLNAVYKKHEKHLKITGYMQIAFGIILFCVGLVSAFMNEKKLSSFLVVFFGLIYLLSFLPNTAIQSTRYLLPTVLTGIIVLISIKLRKYKQRGILFGLTALAYISLFVYYLLAVSAFNPSYSHYLFNLVSWGIIPLVFLVGVYELLRGKDSYKDHIKKLQLMVDAQSKDIKRKETALNTELRKRVILEERQRFTRDIHDGIGSNLLSLLVRLRSKKINMETVQEEVEASMHDLRLVVDSLDHTGDDLSSMLVTFKSRIEPQFRAAGIEWEWDEEQNLLWKPNKTRDILNLYRLFQEAISNILRHANAKHVVVNVTQDQHGNLQIVIEDDGIGLPPEYEVGHGKGLQNMQFRAKRLNGELSFGKNSNGLGTKIKLQVPYYSEPEIHLQ